VAHKNKLDRKKSPPADITQAWARLRIAAPDPHFSLSAIDPADKPFSSGDKAADREAVQQLAEEIDTLQNLFYADRRYKMLLVLQGLDTSGKDGTLRTVFGRTSPIGVRAVAWRAPNDAERAHDPLWRIHKEVPGSGEIVVFNRSHYEDVLVPVVDGKITPEQTAQRYRQINDFERMLCQNGTVILKFMLHISADEQRERLQARVDDPTKRWKFVAGDLEVRKHWNDYQKAYQALLRATSTEWAPWTIVPADSKTHRNLMIASIVRDTLLGLKLRYPPDPPGVAGVKVK
jgi:PPK2 family polyphosphate:nucleotide phosphotransferase